MPTLLNILEAHKNNKNDKKTFGLVIAGGAMRAAYAAGAMMPLITRDLTESFEHVVGASAGAINGTYFIDKYADTMFAYVDDLSNKDFVNLLRRDKKVDVDYAVDTVIRQKHPFHPRSMSRSKSKLHIVLTDAKSGKKLVISDHQAYKNIYEELRASAALPVLYDKQVLIDGKYYIDGAVADALPVDVAIKMGCTDIVVILNQQLKNYQFDKKHTRLEKHLIRLFAKDQPKAIKNILPTDEALLQVNLRRLTKPHKKVHIYVLEPSNEEMMISMASIDKEKIEELGRLGISDMELFLNKQIV